MVHEDWREHHLTDEEKSLDMAAERRDHLANLRRELNNIETVLLPKANVSLKKLEPAYDKAEEALKDPDALDNIEQTNHQEMYDEGQRLLGLIDRYTRRKISLEHEIGTEMTEMAALGIDPQKPTYH